MAVIRGFGWGVGGGAQNGETVENHDPQTERSDIGAPVLQAYARSGAWGLKDGWSWEEDTRLFGSNPSSRVPSSFCCTLAPPPPASVQEKGCGCVSRRNGGRAGRGKRKEGLSAWGACAAGGEIGVGWEG